jgi:uncharacterized protein YciI
MLVCKLTYNRELDRQEPLFLAHKEFVETQVGEGRFLASGPRLDATGGLMLVYGEDTAAGQALIESDPLVKEGVASFELTPFKVGLADPNSSLAGGEPGAAK